MARLIGSISTETGFYELKERDGTLAKAKLKFGNRKEMCVSKFNNIVYVHLWDMSKCYVGGRFDMQKAKSISLRYDELEQVIGNKAKINFYRQKLTDDEEQEEVEVEILDEEENEDPPTRQVVLGGRMTKRKAPAPGGETSNKRLR